MPYVSARYVINQGPIPDPPGAARSVQAIDDQGGVWSLREDSQVGDWLRYIQNGGTIEAADALPETKPATEPEPQPVSGPAPPLPVVLGPPTLPE